MSHDVFISYKSEEFSTANWIREQLEANGISCWMAPMSIRGGSDYSKSIQDAIKKCRYLVMVLSAKAQESQWVIKEVSLAMNQGHVTILPFMIKKCALVDPFEFWFSNIQIYDAYTNPIQALSKMIRDISSEKTAPVVCPPPKKDTKSASRKFKWGWLILILLIAAAGLAYASGFFDQFSTGGEDVALSDAKRIRRNPHDITTASESGAPIATEAIATEEYATKATTEADAGVLNDTKQTATVLALSSKVTETLQKDGVFWYKFSTNSEKVVYRISASPISDEPDSNNFGFDVALCNDLGMNLEEFHVRSTDEIKYVDLILEPNTEYFLRVTTGYWSSTAAGECMLSVETKTIDTGIDQESATEIVLDQQYVYVLNSSFKDWLVFTPEEEDYYKFTVYNTGIKEGMTVILRNRGGSNIDSFFVDDGKTNQYGTRIKANEPIYLNISLCDDDPNIEGTYVVVVEKG